MTYASDQIGQVVVYGSAHSHRRCNTTTGKLPDRRTRQLDQHFVALGQADRNSRNPVGLTLTHPPGTAACPVEDRRGLQALAAAREDDEAWNAAAARTGIRPGTRLGARRPPALLRDHDGEAVAALATRLL